MEHPSGLSSTEKELTDQKEGERREAGVSCAIKKDIVTKLTEMPRPVSDWIMTMRLPLSKDNFATIISVYAPTMTYPDENKEAFYNQLASVLSGSPRKQTRTYSNGQGCHLWKIFWSERISGGLDTSWGCHQTCYQSRFSTLNCLLVTEREGTLVSGSRIPSRETWSWET